MRKNKCAAEHIHIRVTEDEKRRITDAARDAGMTVSELGRTLLLSADAERNAKAICMYESIEKNMK